MPVYEIAVRKFASGLVKTAYDIALTIWAVIVLDRHQGTKDKINRPGRREKMVISGN